MDLYGYMLRHRIVVVGKRVNDIISTQVVASLLALEALDPEREIRLYINSGAGSPYAVTGIIDVMRSMRAPVATIGTGAVGGSMAVVLACGTKGRRYATSNTRIVLQQPLGGAGGSAYEVNIQAKELNHTMYLMYSYLADATGLPLERVEQECDRAQYLNPRQARAMGVIDDIIGEEAPAFYDEDAFLGLIRPSHRPS